jgi:hypothetical protein
MRQVSGIDVAMVTTVALAHKTVRLYACSRYRDSRVVGGDGGGQEASRAHRKGGQVPLHHP